LGGNFSARARLGDGDHVRALARTEYAEAKCVWSRHRTILIAQTRMN
jgi:hypothetical protein